MDFWQKMALAGLAVSIVIGCSEGVQIWMQRKALLQINETAKQIKAMLSGFDVAAALDRTEAATRSGLETLEKALSAHLEPMAQKVQDLDAEALVTVAVDRAAEKFDVKAAAGVAADVIIERAQAAMPAIVDSAKAQVVEGTPGAPQALAMLDQFGDNPIMSAIMLATMQQPQHQQSQQPQNQGVRRI